MSACMEAFVSSVRAKAFPSHLEALLSALGPDGSLTIGGTSPQVSCRVLPSPLSELEAKFYYAGLVSAPTLVARTSTTAWEVPTSPETYQKLQELRAVVDGPPADLDWEDKIASKRGALLDSIKLKTLGPAANHSLKEAEEDGLNLKIRTLLDLMEVKWTSINAVRIGYSEENFVPTVVWISVMPASLSGNDGAAVVSECHKLLVEHDVTNVDVEIWESSER